MSKKLLSICVPLFLKVALNKEENEETQNEIETALLALSCIPFMKTVPKKLYLKETKDVIKHHQDHHNLSRLAYQSVWLFLMNRLQSDKSLGTADLDDLHFVREAAGELEELTKCVDWKREKRGKGEKERGEEIPLMRWLSATYNYLSFFELSEEHDRLIGSIASAYRAAKNNCQDICSQCVETLISAAKNRTVDVADLLKGGAVNIILGELHRPTLKDEEPWNCLDFFKGAFGLLKRNANDETDAAKMKKVKRKLFEKMEEDGYEEWVVGLRYCFPYRIFGCPFLFQNFDDYFVFC
eukprot:MONOS_8962.1-p1 / transcript=MONOS_8962.1 / gene=MONOS_8962 / organism=Monocercomonoides_exilis_PA203 / gene_product=unspecified product / transcript_product=unspecified product / location=Mono_scaffold00353:47482-48467(+) / protein_length=297 / sequence_SO=supercontig / SO=protein_coding / is_pseudo=false